MEQKHNPANRSDPVSETSYRQMVESASDIVARFDRAGCFLYCNAAVERVTGLPPAHFVGRTYREAGLPAALCDMWDDNVERVFRDGADCSSAFDFPTPMGLRHLDFHLMAERSARGTVTSVLAVGRDVTELKRLQESLERKERQLREAQHIAQLGSWEWEVASHRHHWSDEYFRLLGLSPSTDHPSMEAFLQAVHPDDRGRLAPYIADIGQLAATPCFRDDFRLVLPTGEVRHVHGRGEVLFDERGAVVKVIGTLQDVSGWRRADEALRHSDARYRLLAENATDMVSSLTLDLHFAYVSPSAERITGHAVEALVGQPSLTFVHPDDLPGVLESLAELHRVETARAVYRYQHADGHYIWLETTGRAIREPGRGEGGGYLVASRDVSEQVEAQAELQALSRRHELILSSVGEGIYGLDADRRITFINPIGARMLGYEAGELVGRDGRDMSRLSGASLDGWGADVPESGTHEEIVWRPDGTCFHAEFTVARVDEPGVGLGTVVTFRDITARKRGEAEIRRANFELIRHASLKDEFLSTVSHELRTPLAAIRNAVAIVAKEKAGPLNATQGRFMGIIRDHVARLHRIVDDVLDLQRLEAGSMPHRPVVADLRPLVLEVVNSYSPAFAERGIQVAIALPAEPLTAKFDHDRLSQALLNLLSNAAKFTPESGRVTISGKVDAETDSVRLSVEDTGVGIPADELPRIFDKFVQVDGGLTRQVGGTGLGLSICKSIVEGAHGGQLWVESTEGRGTTFHLALPAHAPAEEWLEG
ncbi:MAG: PAS domain S-box protein [Candidatus Sericytochromatia bacterium]